MSSPDDIIDREFRRIAVPFILGWTYLLVLDVASALMKPGFSTCEVPFAYVFLALPFGYFFVKLFSNAHDRRFRLSAYDFLVGIAIIGILDLTSFGIGSKYTFCSTWIRLLVTAPLCGVFWKDLLRFAGMTESE